MPAVRPADADRKYLLERVDEAAVVQLYADGFEALPVDQRILIWHLYQAAIAGRDIFYDQRYAHNLDMRDVLEAILTHPSDDAATQAEILRYTKLFWINTGPYNNLTARKFVLKCTPRAVRGGGACGGRARARHFPCGEGSRSTGSSHRLKPMFFDALCRSVGDDQIARRWPRHPSVERQQSVRRRDDEGSRALGRAVPAQLAAGEEERKDRGRGVSPRRSVRPADPRCDRAISRAPSRYATEPTARALRALIQWYRTGEERDRRAYDIAWVADKSSPVDTINGFTEVYLDARGIKGAWEAIVYYVNTTKTAAIKKLAAEAQWFESRMPWDRQYCKENVQGVTANVIDVVIETGDAGPVTPIGINLPNEQEVREQYGSKSVSISNVNEAYDRSMDPGLRSEFAWSPDEIARAREVAGVRARAHHRSARGDRACVRKDARDRSDARRRRC